MGSESVRSWERRLIEELGDQVWVVGTATVLLLVASLRGEENRDE